MKQNILTDIRKGFELMRTARKARKEGEEICVQAVRELPLLKDTAPGFLYTVEGCVLANVGREVYYSVKARYDAFPEKLKCRLALAPERGDFRGRAIFWQAVLKKTLPKEKYFPAMKALYQWYRHIKDIDRQKEETEKAPGTAATMQGATQKNKLHNHSTVDQAVCQVSRWGEL